MYFLQINKKAGYNKTFISYYDKARNGTSIGREKHFWICWNEFISYHKGTLTSFRLELIK